jgi:hypothetical protein
MTGSQRPCPADLIESREDPAAGPKSSTGKEEPGSADNKPRVRIKPPVGVYINHDDLLTIGNQTVEENAAMLKKLEDKVKSLRRVAQRQKQWLALNDYKQMLDEDAFLELETLEAEEEEEKEREEMKRRREEQDGVASDENSVDSSDAGKNNNNGKNNKAKWTKDDVYIVVEGEHGLQIFDDSLVISSIDYNVTIGVFGCPPTIVKSQPQLLKT